MSQIVQIDKTFYEVIKSSEVIEDVTSKGLAKFWQCHVVKSGDKFYTTSSTWQQTKKGTSVVKWSTPYYAEPKNIGKANETSSEQQAFSEFASKVLKQKTIRNSHHPLPMLAKKFADHKSSIVWQDGVMIQPKLDGMRMLTDGIDNWSRRNKPINERDSRILDNILPLNTMGHILDGELVLPNFPHVSQTMSAIKKYNSDTPRLVYFVYDIVLEDRTFKSRFETLKEIVAANPDKQIRLTPTESAYSLEDIEALHSAFVEQGYEGSIIRSMTGKYKINARSSDLLKYKDFVDEEFEIVDILEAGAGSSANTAVFVCINTDGKEFKSTPTGTVEQRTEYLSNKHKYIGKWAKVKYRELTPDGVPFHSNMLEVRETKEKGF